MVSQPVLDLLTSMRIARTGSDKSNNTVYRRVCHDSCKKRLPIINLCSADPDVANRHNSCSTCMISSEVILSPNLTEKGEA